MGEFSPDLKGTWVVPSGDQNALGLMLRVKKRSAPQAPEVMQMAAVLDWWERLRLRIDDLHIHGDLLEGLERCSYTIRARRHSDEGEPILDLELRGPTGGAIERSALFVRSDRILLLSDAYRLPLQRVDG